MAGRISIIRGKSIAELINTDIQNINVRYSISILTGLAIWVGNAAYQSGNLTGASMGIQSIVELTAGNNLDIKYAILFTSITVGILLFFGKYKVLEKVFLILVILMSLVFILTIFFIEIDYKILISEITSPTLPAGSIFVVMGLIGTTVVPYNIFLHSNAVLKKGWNSSDLSVFRLDLILSVSLGGLISIAILIISASTISKNPNSLLDLSQQLAPLLGNSAGLIFSVGIFAAGVTSSLTAPLAASYAICGLLGKKPNHENGLFRIVWLTILLTGFTISVFGFKPLIVIQFAQFLNGLLLPIIAIMVFIFVNSRKLGANKNTRFNNLVGIFFIVIVVSLGLRSLLNLLL
jgi:Mn2+/Fe2+ NRAMP family transporter